MHLLLSASQQLRGLISCQVRTWVCRTASVYFNFFILQSGDGAQKCPDGGLEQVFVFPFAFWDRFSLCSLGWPWAGTLILQYVCVSSAEDQTQCIVCMTILHPQPPGSSIISDLRFWYEHLSEDTLVYRWILTLELKQMPAHPPSLFSLTGQVRDSWPGILVFVEKKTRNWALLCWYK